MNAAILIITIFLPFLAGAVLCAFHFGEHRKARCAYVAAVTAVELAGVLFLTLSGGEMMLWRITDAISISFCVDTVSSVFALIASSIWLLVAFYSFTYMKHEGAEDRFYTFFLIAEGSLLGMDYASNLICMYVMYEMVTLSGLPLVLHSLKQEAISAAVKYLFYSIAGAFMALLAMFFLARYCTTLDFIPGGALDLGALSGHEGLLLTVLFLAVIGLGAKAGMYPLHGWLPSAHPVAPAPASAVLSAVIAKAGVLGIVRVIYYVAGPEFLRGTWVQYALLGLSLLTVFMGSMMAYREKIFKKRLAYSTVSQISYVLTGLFLLSAEGVLGGLMHVVFHAIIKTALFLTAGSVIFYTGKTEVDELTGIGKQMPITIWSFTLASLALIGIPPASGFVSKWYLAEAALDSGLGFLCWLIPVVLLISALLTAGYLLPITIHGFFPGKSVTYPVEKIEKSPYMWIPLLILAAAAVLFGVFPSGLVRCLSELAAGLA